MDAGHVAEFDSPAALLSTDNPSGPDDPDGSNGSPSMFAQLVANWEKHSN